ncbi:MAG: SWIM zinc finger family protein (plasmid) [Limnothrix sp. BL-A-16]
MIAQTAFSPAYFAQKSLAASLLGTTPRKIESIEVLGDYALVLEAGAVYPVAIELSELETEHDRQRCDRGAGLTVERDGDCWEVTGGDDPHVVYPDPESESLACDCHDYQRQSEAGRDRPYCKHVAAVELSGRKQLEAIATDYRALTDEQAIAAGLVALADLGF